MAYPTITLSLLLLAACASTAITGCPGVPQWTGKNRPAAATDRYVPGLCWTFARLGEVEGATDVAEPRDLKPRS